MVTPFSNAIEVVMTLKLEPGMYRSWYALASSGLPGTALRNVRRLFRLGRVVHGDVGGVVTRVADHRDHRTGMRVHHHDRALAGAERVGGDLLHVGRASPATRCRCCRCR